MINKVIDNYLRDEISRLAVDAFFEKHGGNDHPALYRVISQKNKEKLKEKIVDKTFSLIERNEDPIQDFESKIESSLKGFDEDIKDIKERIKKDKIRYAVCQWFPNKRIKAVDLLKMCPFDELTRPSLEDRPNDYGIDRGNLQSLLIELNSQLFDVVCKKENILGILRGEIEVPIIEGFLIHKKFKKQILIPFQNEYQLLDAHSTDFETKEGYIIKRYQVSLSAFIQFHAYSTTIVNILSYQASLRN